MVHSKFAYALGLFIGVASAVWGQNHTLRSDQVIVNTERHWDNWSFVKGTLNISSSGEVVPAFIPKGNNAVMDILDHLQRTAENPDDVTILDAIEAGSNPTDVANLFDGDETTYWEPDPASPLRDWWFQIDLGRLINATRIGLKFVPEGQGDPFLQFVVLTADNAEKGSQVAGNIPMNQVYRTPSDNKNKRVFELDLDRGEVINPVPGKDFEGDIVRLVQIVVTESNGLRGIEVPAEEYETLAASERGSVVYHKKVREAEVEVEEAIYAAIDPEVRGAIRTQDLGFDEILLRTPPDMSLEFGSLRMGSVAQWNNGQVEEQADIQVVETRADSLWLRLDQLVQRGSETELIEVRFTTALFSTGVVLQAAIGNSSLENSWQQVDPGDVTELAQTQGLQILASASDSKVLDDMAINPPVVTPNGDGVNDAMTFDFAVRRLSGVRPVTVQIFDLSGRPVRILDTLQPVVAGRYSIDWAADDQQGQVVPPGIYILRIDVDVDSDSWVSQTGVQRLLHVAY